MSKKCVIIVENYDDGRNMPVRLRSCLVMKIQESAENYLETILVISHKKGMVRSIDIVNELEFSKPSVSVAMKNLRENGYIEMDKDGYINNWLINNYKGNDYNTNCLKELVNNEMTMDVFITPNFAWKVGTQYRFSEEIYNLPNPYPFGEISINPDTNPLCNL